MSIPVIINPAANSARAAAQVERIRTLTPSPELHHTSGVGNARHLACELAKAGHPLVVAAGGDGTINEVINGLADYAVAAERPMPVLGILPVGTMNVMAYELGLPGRNLEHCWRLIQDRKPRQIDLWQANDQYFAQLAGVGFDAEIVQETPWEMKRRFGPLSYAMTAARVLTREAPVLKVDMPGRPSLFGSIVLVGNGRHYGGPVPMFKHASNDDGLLDVIIFHQRRMLEVLQFIGALTVTDFAACDDLDYIQTSSLQVTAEKATPFEVDGELGAITPVEFRPAPFRLRVIGAPAPTAAS